jgi:general secretion pathway protein A
MYTGFFGLNSQPFSIAPNPDFMYLGARHAEALAHLRYGLGDAGGFVLLTGEVGTGKTTVSRCLLADLPANTQVAFILNPTLSELELLGAICDELKIRYKKTDASLKLLTDKITAKLLKNHQTGINTILIIDEAQHLQPAVLEQLRLLTNLETNTKKLLQVILIGQPELQQLLQRQDLRQLAQRITARYHLMPLTLAEVQHYVQHRLQVAGCSRPVFTEGALKKLFQCSGGIPRLVNLICDRALLGAYSQQKALIEAALIQQAAGEILAIRQPPATQGRAWWWWPLLGLVFLLCIGMGVLLTLLLKPTGV